MELNILLAIIGLIVGLGLGLMYAKKDRARREQELLVANKTAEAIVLTAERDAETLKKEALLEAKEENQKYRSEIEGELK
ncbi:MAG: Rnase Y domain-containing protein, partial [Enterococcus aquimarinus]